jgi:hypothetical protein
MTYLFHELGEMLLIFWLERREIVAQLIEHNSVSDLVAVGKGCVSRWLIGSGGTGSCE